MNMQYVTHEGRMYHIHTRLLKGAQLAIRLSHDTAAVIYVTAVEETWPTKTLLASSSRLAEAEATLAVSSFLLVGLRWARSQLD